MRSATRLLTWGVAMDLKANASGLAFTPARMLSPGDSRSGRSALGRRPAGAPLAEATPREVSHPRRRKRNLRAGSTTPVDEAIACRRGRRELLQDLTILVGPSRTCNAIVPPTDSCSTQTTAEEAFTDTSAWVRLIVRSNVRACTMHSSTGAASQL
jgi:hypothetical protein